MMERIGRYEVLQELGRGAMGAVYKAHDPQIGRTVAIKIILTANLSSEELQQYKLRFYREARAAGQMAHPGIVTIHDIAEDETGQPYLVMEFIEGITLEKMLSAAQAGMGERLPLGQSLDIGIQVADALEYAHRRGVIHRDIKPANILVTPEGKAKIADFGIAKLAGTQFTQAGQLLGTPAFMSPEQFSGGTVDGRSDIFSLGAMLYWMATGEKPFAADTMTAVSFKVVYTHPIPPKQLNPALPADLDTLLLRCMAKNPDERYASASELARDLAAVKSGRPIGAAVAVVPAEKTVVRAMPIPEAAVVVTPVAEAAAPAAPRAERSTVVMVPAAAWPVTTRLRKRVQRVPLAVRAGMGVALIVLLALVGYWLWPREQAVTPAAKETAAPSAPTDSGPPPWAKASPKARRTAPKPVAMSTLNVECNHNFRSATLEISTGGKTVVSGNLRGEIQDLKVVKIARGQFSTSTELPAGSHVLRVRVRSRRDNYEEEGEIGATFRAGAARTLVIEFGKGSGLGIIERKLTLRWE